MTLLYFRLIFFSALAALFLAPLAVRIAPYLRLVDMPGSLPHKRHDHPTPLVGGWVIFISFLAVGLPGLIETSSEMRSIILMGSIVFLFGVVDDLYGLSAPVKLLGQGLAALGLLGQGVQVLLLPPAWGWLNLVITVVWLIGITNAFNFVDSMDGLAVGLAGLSASFFMLAAQESGQPDLATYCSILVGVCIGTYFLNSRPAKMFLGDAGSQWLGFVLAGIGIAYTPQGLLRSQSWFVPILLVGIPIFDTVLIVVSRVRRKRPWYQANLDHTYHRLVRFGMVDARAVLTMHMAQLVLGCLAFILLSMPSVWANLIFAGMLVGGGGLMLWMDARNHWY